MFYIIEIMIFDNQLIINHNHMNGITGYAGLKIATDTLEWKEMQRLFPKKTSQDLNIQITTRLEKILVKAGFGLDTELYRMTLAQVVNMLEIAPIALVAPLVGIWTKNIESVMMELVLIGGGECEECGADKFEDWDYGDCGEVIHICGVCGNRQEL